MRTITYTVGVDSITPSTVQFGGFAGEDCATTLKFTFNEFIRNEVFAKLSGKGIICLEVIDGSGEFGCYALEEWATESTESASFAIPKEITELGGRVNMQLSIIELDEVTFKQKRKLFTYPIKLRFEPSVSGGVENAVAYEKYHTDVVGAMLKAENYAKNANLAANWSKRYAVGGTGLEKGENTDNAKHYYEQVEKRAEEVLTTLNQDAVEQLVETCTDANETAQDALKISEEANDKYDACVEATNDAKKVKAEIEAGGYIESLKEMNNGSKFSVWIGTSEEYDALDPKLNNCLYIKTDDKMLENVKTFMDENAVETSFDFEINSYCEKHSNGVFKAKGKYSFKGAICNVYENSYYAPEVRIQLNEVFGEAIDDITDIFDISANIGLTNELLGVNIVSYDKTGIKFYVFSHKSFTDEIEATITFDLLGKWK